MGNKTNRTAPPAGTQQDNKKTEEPRSLNRELLEWLEVIVIAVAVAFCLNSFIIANSVIPSESMENTIMAGDRVIGSRLSYLTKDPQRGDIIIFKWPDNEKVRFVKRVIGLPGETVDIIDGKVYINGSSAPLDEPYLAEPMKANETPMHFEVPEGAWFCMGDNRNHSLDARYWKNTYVYKNKILAKVLFRYYPEINKIE